MAIANHNQKLLPNLSAVNAVARTAESISKRSIIEYIDSIVLNVSYAALVFVNSKLLVGLSPNNRLSNNCFVFLNSAIVSAS